MDPKYKLKYMGKLIEASRKRDKGFWIFTTDDKEIIVESSNLPISPPAGQLPVEIRPARYKRRFQSMLIIRYKCYADICEGINGNKELARVKHQLNLKNDDTLAAADTFIKTLKRDSAGEICAKSGEASIERFVNGFQHEAVFQDGRAALVTVTESTVSKQRQKNNEGKMLVKINRKLDEVIPHARRGIAVIKAASEGGKTASKIQEIKRKAIRLELTQTIAAPGKRYLSLTRCREIIAKRHSVSRRSVERYTRGVKRK